MMVVILNQLGLSVEYLALIVAVDRILDMARTSLNVTSDMVVTKIVDVLSRKGADRVEPRKISLRSDVQFCSFFLGTERMSKSAILRVYFFLAE